MKYSKTLKTVTYAKFVKDNNIPKTNQSSIIPKKAIIISHAELPIGVESSLAKTDGLGFDAYMVVDKNHRVLLKYCRKEHGHWFTWE